MPARAADVRRAAVLGSPIAHSLSPVLHRAAYRELGLDDWSYDRFEVDEEALPKWLEGQRRGPAGVAEVRDDPALLAEIQSAVDEANKAVSKAEAIRVFRILPRDFTEATGELTPSLKVKRAVVMKEYSDDIDAIYLR